MAANSELSVAGQLYTHGFAMLALRADGSATADYFEDHDGGARKIHTEVIA